MGQVSTLLVAPASFKGSLSAGEVAGEIERLLKPVLGGRVNICCCPIADGGDDSLQVLQAHDPTFQLFHQSVPGPLPKQNVDAGFLIHPEKNLAVVEAAQAHGYKLLSEAQRSAGGTTSYGVGELIRTVAQQAPSLTTLLVTVGGSASTDGGAGALQALGVQFLDGQGQVIKAPLTGQMLSQITRIVPPDQWPFAGQLLIATDVLNPLLGSEGTAFTFAPQKGATPAECVQLEDNLTHFSHLMQQALGVDYASLPGVGAAGGLAYGLKHVPRSGILSGAQWFMEMLGLPAKISQSQVIITGEGRLDMTTFSGKATGQLLMMAAEKPVLFFCGRVQAGLPLLPNVVVYPLAESDMQAEDALQNPRAFLRRQIEAAVPKLKNLLQLSE